MKAACAMGLLTVAIFAGQAAGQTPESDQKAAGQKVAQRYCGECHAVGEDRSPLADAPPMSQLYLRFPVDRMTEALETGMLNDHPRMPEFKLGPDEEKALTAYLSSFQPPRPRRVRPLPKSPNIVASSRSGKQDPGRWSPPVRSRG